MKLGDLVRFRRDGHRVGVVVDTLCDDGWFDVLSTDGATIFIHKDSLVLISEAR